MFDFVLDQSNNSALTAGLVGFLLSLVSPNRLYPNKTCYIAQSQSGNTLRQFYCSNNIPLLDNFTSQNRTLLCLTSQTYKLHQWSDSSQTKDATCRIAHPHIIKQTKHIHFAETNLIITWQWTIRTSQTFHWRLLATKKLLKYQNESQWEFC